MNNSKNDIGNLVDHLFRKEYGRLVSYLTYLLGQDMMLYAEDIAQDTIEDAFKSWRDREIPKNPSAWLFSVAKNKAFNFISRNKKYTHLLTDKWLFLPEENTKEIRFESEIDDSMLHMFFACCSPKISYDNQIILILNTLCGFSRVEISRALLIGEETLKKRLFRLKKEIRDRKIEFSIPQGNVLKPRLHAIKNTLYLCFNNGYNSYQGKQIIQKDICLEAMRLCKLIVKHFPNDPEGKALLALMCYHVARFDARTDYRGEIVLLEDQDRRLWDSELIDLGHYYLSEASEDGAELSTYHIEANIAAIHCNAGSFGETDWNRLAKLYTWLYLYKPSPVIKLNLAIVESKISGLTRSIEMLNMLENEEKDIAKYHLFYAIRGDFYQQIKDYEKAITDFNKALDLVVSVKESSLIKNKLKGALDMRKSSVYN